jgi:hypothetical protein
MICEKSVRELPDIIPFTIHESIIGEFVSRWNSICLKTFVEVEKLLKGLVETLCQKYFARFRSSGLLDLVE